MPGKFGDQVAVSPIGARRPRASTRRALEGRARYVGDIVLPRMAHIAFVRSPHARARIIGIDTSQARALDGVIAVITGEELARHCQAWTCLSPCAPGVVPPMQYALAPREASFHGEPVVAVVASSRAIAEDGVDLVRIEWQPLPATPDLEGAVNARPAHSELKSNLVSARQVNAGSVEAAFAQAALIVEETFHYHRQTGVPMETRGVVADFNSSDQTMQLHHSHQLPNMVQSQLARLLGIGEQRVRVVLPDIGGGFGIKMHCYQDEIATAALSKLLGRPVKFIADRRESFLADVHAREMKMHARMALDASGRILGLNVHGLYGMGPYSTAPFGSILDGFIAVRCVAAAYDFESFRAVTDAVYQNRTPVGQYRGVGNPMGVAMGERLMDLAAARLRQDPAELRMRNLLDAGETPISSAAGTVMVNMSHKRCLRRLLEMAGYEGLKRERDSFRKMGIYRGIGLCVFVETTAYSAAVHSMDGVNIVPGESVTLKVEPDGGVRCLTGLSEIGQGVSAGMAQVVAAAMGLPVEEVHVSCGDTGASAPGGGAAGSRGLAQGGDAAWQAGRQLRGSLLRLAAVLSRVPEAQLEMAEGSVLNRETGQRLYTLGQLAAIYYYRNDLIPAGGGDIQLAITHHAYRDSPRFIPANGTQLSYVEVDIHTGFVRPLKHWAVDDCGRIVNPLLVEEQIRGGIVQGIGSALTETCRYDGSGRLLTMSFGSYIMPVAPDVPDIVVDHLETPYGGTELGLKGVGEAGTIGAPAAVINAVNDALSPLGASIAETPMTPMAVLEAINRAAQPAAQRKRCREATA